MKGFFRTILPWQGVPLAQGDLSFFPASARLEPRLEMALERGVLPEACNSPCRVKFTMKEALTVFSFEFASRWFTETSVSNLKFVI